MRSLLLGCTLGVLASGCFLFHGPPGTEEEREPAPAPGGPTPAPPGPDECEIHIAEDGPVYPDAVVSWQAPGGFAGHGPAVIAHGSGTVRIWREVTGFDPFGMPDAEPDVVVELPFYEIDQLVERYRRADRASLPHDAPWAECYPVLAVRECATCDAEMIAYSTPDQLLPELGCVFDWYDTRLADVLPSTPRTFCDF